VLYSRAARNRASMVTVLKLEAFSCNLLRCKRLTCNHGSHIDRTLLNASHCYLESTNHHSAFRTLRVSEDQPKHAVYNMRPVSTLNAAKDVSETDSMRPERFVKAVKAHSPSRNIVRQPPRADVVRRPGCIAALGTWIILAAGRRLA
jgi:hypothetical protein